MLSLTILTHFPVRLRCSDGRDVVSVVTRVDPLEWDDGAPHESIRTGSTTTPFILCTSFYIYTMAQTSNPKGRNLIAVIGDEVCISIYGFERDLMS